jgi:hypothetical protein
MEITGITDGVFSEDRSTFTAVFSSANGPVSITLPVAGLERMASFFLEAEQRSELLDPQQRMAGERSRTQARRVERLEVETGKVGEEYFVIVLFEGGTLRHHYSLTYPLAGELQRFLGDKLRNRPQGKGH